MWKLNPARKVHCTISFYIISWMYCSPSDRFYVAYSSKLSRRARIVHCILNWKYRKVKFFLTLRCSVRYNVERSPVGRSKNKTRYELHSSSFASIWLKNYLHSELHISSTATTSLFQIRATSFLRHRFILGAKRYECSSHAKTFFFVLSMGKILRIMFIRIYARGERKWEKEKEIITVESEKRENFFVANCCLENCEAQWTMQRKIEWNWKINKLIEIALLRSNEEFLWENINKQKQMILWISPSSFRLLRRCCCGWVFPSMYWWHQFLLLRAISIQRDETLSRYAGRNINT